MTETNILKSNGKIFLTVSLHRYRQLDIHKGFSISLKIILSLCFFHEQARDDGDRYIEIKWENILDGEFTPISATTHT